ncbi:MAG: CoA activase, partial [Deltaproteobacteria bacterium]
MSKLFLGIDVGSVSANTVIMDEKANILEEHYDRIMGQPLKKVMEILKDVTKRYPYKDFERIAFTGNGGNLLAHILNAHFANEIIAQANSVYRFFPDVKTIIDIGGEDSKLILIDKIDYGEGVKIVDFSMNTLCAAGTGSFLDQQANRLNLTIEEFGKLSLKSKNPPRIAGRCSVFAKTDMIHLQQIATPDYDIVAGLCFALARNFISNIAKGKKMKKPIVFQGGVAANIGMIRAFRESLDLKEGELIIPKHHASMGAIGAVLIAQEEEKKDYNGIDVLEDYILHKIEKQKGMKPLSLPPSYYIKRKVKEYPLKQEKIPAYLGLDVGSISTNLVVIDEQHRVLAKQYLMTAGRPIEAIRTGLKAIGEEIGDKVIIMGVGSTGSGRYLTGDFVGADIVRNEITAQATAAIDIDPEVDTIFEIGGQDSKYISIDNGAVVDFEMNKACAAGTGSFLEEQAEKLGISIKEEFGNLALSAPEPVKMGERCTVFIESDLVHHQQQGAKTPDLVAGLAYSIVQNYINRVVGDRRIGKRIFFQGGTAFNKGVVAAFRQWLGKEVFVPENHDVTGAIGVAILAQRERTWEKSRFKGFDLSNRKYTLTSFECKGCANHCLIRKVSIEGEPPLFYGSRCEKYDVVRRKKDTGIPDLFKEREEMIFSRENDEELPEDAPKIGIPRALLFHEVFPFWRAFFNALGYRVVLSDPTNKDVIRKGVETVVVETCFPVKVAHGHVLNLLEKGIKDIFIPSIVALPPISPDIPNSQNCPYTQSFPYTVHSSIDAKEYGARVIQPVVFFNKGEKVLYKNLVELGKMIGRNRLHIKKAMKKAKDAQDSFYAKLAKRGKEILENLKPDEKAMVIVGRPYNSCDAGVNLDIPKKLRELGVLPIPMDFIPQSMLPITEDIKEMYWRYGQKILATAKVIKDDPRLYAIYITNFGCGADSFIAHFFRQIMLPKPYLTLEIDEHSADAGAITRCEAFLDSLKNVRVIPKKEIHFVTKQRVSNEKKILYIPYMCDHSFALAAAFQANGVDARVFPESDEETLFWGRKLTTGKECFPCILTTGDMVKVTKMKDFDPKKAAFFMPSGTGPCRFGQYNRFHRLVLDELGFKSVAIYAPNQDARFYDELQMINSNFTRLGWQAIVSVDLLTKKLHETRPYEVNKGETDKVYKECLEDVCQAIREGGEHLEEALIRSREKLDNIKTTNKGSKPKIGVVGEIYVRSNRFSNENVIRKIEVFGGEAILATISEWVFYINAMAKRKVKEKWNFSNFLSLFIKDFFQKYDEHRLGRIFKGSIKEIVEPKSEELFKLAKPYVDSTFEGETILTVGKAIELAKHGASGIVNVMPFTCMPGTIVSALLKRFKEE